MTEHEKLKEICDLIGVEIPEWERNNMKLSWSKDGFRR